MRVLVRRSRLREYGAMDKRTSIGRRSVGERSGGHLWRRFSKGSNGCMCALNTEHSPFSLNTTRGMFKQIHSCGDASMRARREVDALKGGGDGLMD
jgi:hypothetical protein